jgi:hypothetical protein
VEQHDQQRWRQHWEWQGQLWRLRFEHPGLYCCLSCKRLLLLLL